MTLSRRGLLACFASALAAPAIVKVESLMKLARTEVIRPSFADIHPYIPFVDGEPISRLDVLYGKIHVRPEWVVEVPETLILDDYSARILAPMINRMQEQIAAAVMNGTSSGGLAGLLGATSPLE